MQKRRAYRVSEVILIRADAPGSMRVVVERIERGKVRLVFQPPLNWVIVDEQCKEAS